MTASAQNERSPPPLTDSPASAVEDRLQQALATELEWLAEVSPTLAESPWPKPSTRREHLLQLLTAAVSHLGCMLGAVLVPARYLRLVRGSPTVSEAQAEKLSAELEAPILNQLRESLEPMLVNRARTDRSSQPLRLLALPVATRRDGPGALVLVRSVEAPRFANVHVALARHLSRLIAAILESDLDAATGLHTRASLQDQLERWKPREHPSGNSHSIVSIRIDRLDAINRTSGFAAGDAAIAAVAGLLDGSHLPSEALAARISGNEFAVVLPFTEPEQAQGTAEMLQRLSGTLLAALAGGPEPVTLSCGIASFGSTRECAAGLALAQLACKSARARGAGRIEIYHDSDVSMVQRHTDILAVRLLQEALREDRLTLYAQRIAPLQDTSRGGGYELLLRSLDDLEENRAPLHLLAAAHRNHLAPAVDLWVVEHALAQAAPYRSELKRANVSVSINVSGPSLTDQRFLERIRVLLAQSRIEPGLVTFEITETVAVLSLAKAVNFIRELRALGCRFALDDFGTGVNSLKNLTSLPVDCVKIDGSFVADILENRQSESMVRAIVGLARDLGIRTVAEYAESRAIIERLRELGVENAQGYGVEKPRPLSEVLAALRVGAE
ncbi:MAG TPA: EAL domain-containing protein [Steroidobacteraceae bacterium]|nr:EAL domain-containing protein [Steroidobacteraceae bacterium]